jgi:SHS2 domain-containing protein
MNAGSKNTHTPRQPFVILEHPADLGIEAFGRSIAEAFQNAALGLMSIILDTSTVAETEERAISLRGTDYDQLLVKWLSEILYLYDGQGFAGKRFAIRVLESQELEALVWGETYSPSKHPARLDVKAVTYHQLLIEQQSEGARVRVYLDI